MCVDDAIKVSKMYDEVYLIVECKELGLVVVSEADYGGSGKVVGSIFAGQLQPVKMRERAGTGNTP